MNRPLFFRISLLFAACLLVADTAFGFVTLPAIFSDHMVVQQSTAVKLWGWGKPGEKITVTIPWSKTPLQAVADNQAHWEVVLQTPAAGGPFEIMIKGYNEVIIHDVLVGEVWLCSGQSNMEWTPGAGMIGGEEEIRQASHPNLRFFTVNTRTAHTPQIDLSGRWVVCTPETMKEFSAIGYVFGRDLLQALNQPVGMINSSWGGTPAEAWMPEEAFDNNRRLTVAAASLEPVPWGPVEIARIYNAMIAPITNYPIAGALWYQGESNVGNGTTYTELLSTLIASWRKDRGYDFPFYFAQIAPYKYGKPFEGAVLRDAQRKVLSVPGTAMVVTSDIGDTTDIHPRNKVPVGNRFANLALVKHYHVKIGEVSSPQYHHILIKGNEIHVYFDHAEGLNAPGGAPDLFEIAGADGVFFPAKARIEIQVSPGSGQTEMADQPVVVLESKSVKAPVSVRFAWRSTATPNLVNGAGLPASCFLAE